MGFGGLKGLALCALTLVLCVAPAAANAAGFLPAETVPGAGSPAGQVATAMAANGYAAAAWVETLTGGQSAIEVAVRPPGGTWSTQQLDVGSPNGGRSDVSVAVNSAGQAAVAWDDVTVNNLSQESFTALVSTRGGGQAFGQPQTIAAGARPVVGIDGAGRVIMIDTESATEFVREWTVGGSLPGAGQQIGTNCEYYLSQLVVAPTGAALAGLECNGPTFVRRSTSGTWAPPSNVEPDNINSCPPMSFGSATSNFATDVEVGIDGQGNPAGVFLDDQRTQQCGLVLTTDTLTVNLVEPTGTSMALATPAVATADNSEFSGPTLSAPDVAVGDGSQLVSWNSGQLGSSLNQNAQFFSLSGSPSGSPQTISSGNVVSRGTVAFSASGYALDSFGTAGAGSSTNLVAAFRRPGGSFASPTGVASGASGNADAIDDAGDGLVAFEQGSSGPAGAQVTGFEATPPVITGASIPSSETAGLPAQFTATANDFWGLVTLAWTFGDGGSANGGAVTHSFSSPGNHTVTVTASDGVGDTATRSGTVTVAGARPETPVIYKTPVVSYVSETHRRFRVGSTRTAITARRHKPRVPVGTTFRFRLNEPARVSIVIAGRQTPPHCSRKSATRGRRRCKPRVRKWTLTRTGHAGANTVAFSGRVGRTPLPAGHYMVTITGTASGLKSQTRRLSFTIVS